jgi:hypothetical protein
MPGGQDEARTRPGRGQEEDRELARGCQFLSWEKESVKCMESGKAQRA